MINITVNQKSYSFQDAISLVEVLGMANIQLSGIAVAVNEEIVPKSDWQSHLLNDQDRILVIQATQGG